MRLKWLYLFRTAPGLIIPWAYLDGRIFNDDINLSHFFHATFVGSLSTAVAADLLITAMIFFIFDYVDSKRNAIKNLWYLPDTRHSLRHPF